MKKFTIAIVAFAAMILASCGGQKTQQDAEGQDTTKTFEQEQIEAAIKMHMDSLATQIDQKDFAAINQSVKEGKIVLTADEKKVKPSYLLNPEIAADMTTAAQKYAAMTMLEIDNAVAGLYDIDQAPYDQAISKLVADVNDPAIKMMEETEGDYKTKHQVLYTEMEKEGRINFYWISTSAGTIENLYIMSQNVDKFLNGYTDDQVANITFRLFCIIDALDRLAEYDPQVPGIAEALQPLKDINAITVDEFKKQLTEAKEQIEVSRKAFLQ